MTDVWGKDTPTEEPVEPDDGRPQWQRDAQPGQAEEKPPEPLKLIRPTIYQGKPVPPREWLVQDWIPMEVVTGVYGDGGVGKSLLLQQLMTSAALGRGWLGLPVQRVKVIGFFCEDPLDELHRRQHDINTEYGCEFSDLTDVLWIPRFGDNNLLMVFEQGVGAVTPVYDMLVSEALRFGARFVVVDTVADTYGGNENDRGQVRQFVQAALGKLARDIKGCVVAAAHPSRAGMATKTGDSGSTGWSNAFRSRAYLKANKDEHDNVIDPYARTLERKKANYALASSQIDLVWNNGVLIPKHVKFGLEAAVERRKAARVFLDLLDRVKSEGQHVSHNSRAGNYAPRVFGERPDREGYDKRGFERAMQELFASSQIRVGSYVGANRSPYECIVRQPEPEPNP